jgi:hypothetical protein
MPTVGLALLSAHPVIAITSPTSEPPETARFFHRRYKIPSIKADKIQAFD